MVVDVSAAHIESPAAADDVALATHEIGRARRLGIVACTVSGEKCVGSLVVERCVDGAAAVDAAVRAPRSARPERYADDHAEDPNYPSPPAAKPMPATASVTP